MYSKVSAAHLTSQVGHSTCFDFLSSSFLLASSSSFLRVNNSPTPSLMHSAADFIPAWDRFVRSESVTPSEHALTSTAFRSKKLCL